jgi:hypothetical protein
MIRTGVKLAEPGPSRSLYARMPRLAVPSLSLTEFFCDRKWRVIQDMTRNARKRKGKEFVLPFPSMIAEKVQPSPKIAGASRSAGC